MLGFVRNENGIVYNAHEYLLAEIGDIIDTITMPNHHGRVSPNQYLLVDILAEFISGKSKSTVFTYISVK